MTVAAFFWITACQTLVGLLVDAVIGDPPGRPHPARWIGMWIHRLEGLLRTRCANLRSAGILLCAGTVFPAAGIVLLLSLLLLKLDQAWFLNGRPFFSPGFSSGGTIPWCTVLGGGFLCGVWFSFRSLAVEAKRIQRLLEAGDLPQARAALAMIVGRDTDALGAEEISRAAIESVAENSVDGGLSPAVYALLGGPVLVTFFKAASTLDSMVGYRSEMYRELGWASARLDDVLNFLPARLAFFLCPLGALLSGERVRESFRIGRRDGRKHPSPNAAIGESLFAGALGIQLGGSSTYRGVVSEKPYLGDALMPTTPAAIGRAVRLLNTFPALCGVLALLVILFAVLSV